MVVSYDAHQSMIGPYKLQHVLGQGKLSTLYLAIDPRQHQLVTLTTFTISPFLSGLEQQRFLSRFTQEVAGLCTLYHPNILPVQDYGEQDGDPYLVIPTAGAESLGHLLGQHQRWSLASIHELLLQVGSALDFAHQRGIVHGSLRPANILLDPQNQSSLIQVTGLGLGRLVMRHGIDDDGHLAQLLSVAGTFLGSIEYMAPECVQGAPADPRSDIYALGCILFELFTGRPPFSGTPLEILAQQIEAPTISLYDRCMGLEPDLLEQLERVVVQALSYDPTQRFQSVITLAEAYEHAIAPFLKSGIELPYRSSHQQTFLDPDDFQDDSIETELVSLSDQEQDPFMLK